jgi:hypothetical protein
MSVSAISSSSGVASTTWQSQAGQVQSDFQSLGKALRSGDLSSAQQAFAVLQKDLQAGQSSSATDNSALNAVGSALQSGNITAAQQAFAALKGHHHGHHHGGGGGAAALEAAAPTTSSSASTGTSLNAVA